MAARIELSVGTQAAILGPTRRFITEKRDEHHFIFKNKVKDFVLNQSPPESSRRYRPGPSMATG